MLVFSPTLATVGVHKKVPERRKYGMSHLSSFESEKEKDRDFQPTKKRRIKPSASKGNQSTSLKCYCWKTILKRYVPKIPRTQSGQFQLLSSALCCANSVVDKGCTEFCCWVLCLFLVEAWKTNGESLTTKDAGFVRSVQPACPHSVQCPRREMCRLL